LAGRKIFLGYTLFAWTAGYNVPEREKVYFGLFQETNPETLIHLLNKHKIAYVAIDDGIRQNTLILRLNESVYAQYFRKVFDDTENQYANLAIYEMPVVASVNE